MASKSIPYRRVARLHDLTSQHFAFYSSPGLEGAWEATQDTQTVLVRGLVKAAISYHDLPELLIPALSIPVRRRETPSNELGLTVIRFLRAEVLKVIQRWRRVDKLVQGGTDLIALYRQDPTLLNDRQFVCTEADAHATYRALVKLMGIPIPGLSDMSAVLGVNIGDLPVWWPRHPEGHERSGKVVRWRELVAGTYPTSEDVSIFHLLFVARSAWNATTAASINLRDWSGVYDEQHAWLYSPKDRSRGAAQWTVSRTGETTGCHSLVTLLAERSEELRRYTEVSPDECNLPDIAARSPWAGVTVSRKRRVYVVDPYERKTANNWLISLMDKFDDRSRLKSEKMTIGMFRDIAAAAIFKDSHYSSWVLMVLLGHKNLMTTRHYGYSRSSFEESFSLVSEVVDDVFSQLRINRIFDIAMTRAKLSKMRVSDADIKRLYAARSNRTYDGSGCANPLNPPPEIDPGQPKGWMHKVCPAASVCV